jgi:hypothetical protein
MKISFVPVPARALLGRHIGLDQMGDNLTTGRSSDAEIAIEEEIAQAFAFEWGIALFNVTERGFDHHLPSSA